MAENENWDIVIKPKDKQTILGPLWYVIQPALTVIMYMVVFGLGIVVFNKVQKSFMDTV